MSSTPYADDVLEALHRAEALGQNSDLLTPGERDLLVGIRLRFRDRLGCYANPLPEAWAHSLNKGMAALKAEGGFPGEPIGYPTLSAAFDHIGQIVDRWENGELTPAQALEALREQVGEADPYHERRSGDGRG